jgi:hypothetical protein
MSYEIKPLRYEDLDRIYPEAEKDAIGRITNEKRHWPQDMYGGAWAVDEQTGVFLAYIPCVRLDPARRYLFGIPGGVAILRMEAYCLFAVLYLSPGLRDRMDEVQTHVRDVFRAVGEFIDGTTDENDAFAVPNARIKNLNSA